VIVILNIPHAVHVSHTNGNDVAVMSAELVEGLIIAARELIREA